MRREKLIYKTKTDIDDNKAQCKLSCSANNARFGSSIEFVRVVAVLVVDDVDDDDDVSRSDAAVEAS